MNLANLKVSFSSLDEHSQHALIMEIRLRRRNALTAVKSRQTRAARSPSTPKHIKDATSAIDNMTPEQAAQILAMLEEDEA
jgi:hypothetical protein